MCGRCTLYTIVQELMERFKVKQAEIPFQPSYNICPSRTVLCVVKDEQGENQFKEFIWGLVPHWAPEPTEGFINAKSETVHIKPSFKDAFQKRRCLVVADGFYEWQKAGKTKTPMYIRLKSGKPFGFAGLYGIWKPKPNSMIQHEVATCTIITTEPNDLMKPIHHRMPVILPEKAEDPWLNPNETDLSFLHSLLKPYDANEMEAYEVSNLVNSPKNNTPECIAPLAESPKATPISLSLDTPESRKAHKERMDRIVKERSEK